MRNHFAKIGPCLAFVFCLAQVASAQAPPTPVQAASPSSSAVANPTYVSILMVAYAVGASPPTSQVTDKVAVLQLPRVVDAESSVKEAGIGTVTTASDAEPIPALDAMTVSTTLEPAQAGSGDTEETTERPTVGVPVKFTSWFPDEMLTVAGNVGKL